MDLAIYPYSLTACTRDIADGLHKAGRADKCGGCGKPFTAARKLKFVSRARHINIQGVQYDWSWPLCRKCARENLRTGSVHERLQREAYAELVLLAVTPLGIA